MKKQLKIFFVILLVVFMGILVQTDYYLIKPGSAEELGEMIHIEGKGREEEGQFFMVTVAQQQANLWLLLYGAINPLLDLRPISGVIPPNMSPEEYNKLMQSMMQESKYLAQIISLRKAGYDVPIVSDGVEIAELIPGSPAENILLPGDIIKEVDDQKVNLAEEVVNLIQEKNVGERVRLTIQRDGSLRDFYVPTVAHTDLTQKAALKIYVRTVNWQPVLPLEIDIDTGPVIGPSAGMMFVLELLDRLVPENLTGGNNIAGTGTISLNEKVGAIGGVKQKVAAAEMGGIKYFLVPEENYEEAARVARDIMVISVDTLDDALGFLHGLGIAARNN